MGCNLPGGGKKFVSAWKIEVVDHIDQQQTGVMGIRRTPVQVVLRSRLNIHNAT